MQLEIITPQKSLFSDEAKLIQLPGEKGLFEILDNHAPIIAVLKEGTIKVQDSKGNLHFFEITQGFVECKQNKTIVLASKAIRSSV
jgi:F-type H+-transporting ATPase subunit epsilon